MPDQPRHKAQLGLCHEKIAGRKLPGGKVYPQAVWCDLKAWGWCYDCDYFVCNIHANSRHIAHRVEIEAL